MKNKIEKNRISTWTIEVWGATELTGPGKPGIRAHKNMNIIEARGDGWDLWDHRLIRTRKPERELLEYPNGIVQEKGTEHLYYRDNSGNLHPCNMAFAWHVVQTGEVPCELDGIGPLLYRGFYVDEISEMKSSLKELRRKRRQAVKRAASLFNITID